MAISNSSNWLKPEKIFTQLDFLSCETVQNNTCVFCRQCYLHDTKQFLCGHCICCNCLGPLFHLTTKCPMDNFWEKPQNETDQLLNAEVRCLHKDVGCTYVAALKDLPDHLIECQFARIKCPQGCCEDVPKFQLQEHSQKHCQRRNISCSYCKHEIAIWEMEEHYDVCIMYPIDCPLHCGDCVPRKTISDHISKCPNSIMSCKYAAFGCPFNATMLQLVMHEADTSYHLELIMQENMNQSTTFKTMLTKMTNHMLKLENKLDKYREKLETNSAITELLQQQVQKLNQNVLNIEYQLAKQMNVKRSLENASINSSSDDIMPQLKENLDQVTTRLDNLEKMMLNSPNDQLMTNPQMQRIEEEITRLNEKMETDITPMDGIFVWTLVNVHKHFKEAVNEKLLHLSSEHFLTSRYGYKMCLLINFNGNDEAKGTHVSLFVALKKGQHDHFLTWPFKGKITLQMLNWFNRNKDIQFTLQPGCKSNAIKDPPEETIQIFGISKFVAHQDLFDFVVHDKLYLKAIVKIC